MRRGLGHLVSDHAVVRWLERMEGIDVEAIRERILAHNVLSELSSQDISSTGTSVQHPDGATVVVRGARVITVTTEEGRKP